MSGKIGMKQINKRPLGWTNKTSFKTGYQSRPIGKAINWLQKEIKYYEN